MRRQGATPKPDSTPPGAAVAEPVAAPKPIAAIPQGLAGHQDVSDPSLGTGQKLTSSSKLLLSTGKARHHLLRKGSQ